MTTTSTENISPEFGPPPDADPVTWGLYGAPEVKEPVQLPVQGTIPSWVKGSLYRGAAATWDVGSYTAEHWFDGFSRNHRFEIANGTISYRSRNSSDEIMHFVRETGRYPATTFGGDPCKTIFGAFENTYRDGTHSRGKPSAGVVGVSFAPNFAGLSGRNPTEEGGPFKTLVATSDANELQEIDPVTLEPLELFTYEAFDKFLVNSSGSAAHPVVGSDGSVYNYILDTASSEIPTYHIFGILPPNGSATILASITDAPPAYIHALFGSESHLVLVVWQADLVSNAPTLLDSLGPWDPNRKTLFYVIDRLHGRGLLRKYESADAFFAFHEINTFEDPNGSGDILLDLPRMDDYSFLTAAKIANLRANLGTPNATAANDLAGAFTRYRLPFYESPPPTSSTGNEARPTHEATVDIGLPLTEANIELPRINPANAGKPYRYAYGIHVAEVGNFADSIIKIDAHTKTWKVWTPKTRHVPSEPIFVARPPAYEGEVLEEDDGVLLTVVLDRERRGSSVVVLDARSMQELARAEMPVVMTYGFHGCLGWAGLMRRR